MKQLDVSIEIGGVQTPVGAITCETTADAHFQYAQTYLDSASAKPISVSLPLQEEAFTPRETQAFFEGLLPEGFTRRTLAQWMRVHEGDYLSILSGLGKECLGAIQIAAQGEAPSEAAYESLSEAQMCSFAREGAQKSAEWATKSHLSLTGASGKIGLYYDQPQESWYLPLGQAPSTHIVKQSHVRLEDIVVNEQLCLLTAQQLGIAVPESFVVKVPDAGDDALLFATKRYDRVFADQSQTVSGLPVPLRLHQEDFAQALGMTSFEKYEPAQGHYLQALFRLLLLHSANPLKDRELLWDILIFDFLIGNTDNHIKNLSFLYSADLKGKRLAPAYDMLSTAVYESSTRDMALSVGGAVSLDELGRTSFETEAQMLGVGTKKVLQQFDVMANRFEAALRSAADDLVAQGFSSAATLTEKILQKGGFHHL